MKPSIASYACLIALALSSPAWANDYVSTDDADWFRYTNSVTGQEVTAEIQLQSGGWALWDQFAGLGSRWIYTDPSHDWLWVWNGQQAVLVGNLGRGNGWSFVGELDALNAGPMKATTGRTLTTAAGAFTDVTELEMTTRAADAGVTKIWFAKGVGVVKWTEQSIAGPVSYELSMAMVGGQMLPNPTSPPPPPPTGNLTVSPPEWADTETMLWGCDDTYLVLDVYEDSFKALDGLNPRVISDVSVASQNSAAQLQYEMAARNVPMNDVDIYVAAVQTVWMRDYGPIILRDPNGQLVVGDPNYYPGRPVDDDFPVIYSQFRGWPRVHADLAFEGGNYISDGNGQLFVSRGALWFNQGMTRTQVEDELKKLGGDRVEFFEPLVQEGTTHIDMFIHLLSGTKAVVSDYPAGHRQKPVVDAAAATLQGMGYGVTRLLAHTAHDEYATYSNATQAGNVVLVPQYGDAQKDRAALDSYAGLGFTAKPVDCSLIILYGGAVHCVSMHVPR